MAQLSLGEAKWRMLRRVVRSERFAFADARNTTRADRPGRHTGEINRMMTK